MIALQTLMDTGVMGAAWLKLELPSIRGKHSSSGRHLALFARALPPHSGAGVYRPLSLIQYGIRRGWAIDAFHGESDHKHRAAGEELLARVPTGAKLHVVGSSHSEPSYRFFPRVDGGFTNALEFARQAIATLESNPPDYVLASGPPFFAFVAALFTARHFRVPLILDYRDEWTECPFDFVTKDGSDRAWERRCLRRADAVLFTTRSHLEHQLAVFPELDARKTHLVPNGWEPADFTSSEHDVAVDGSDETRPFVIAHVGNLAGHTAPNDFFESFERLLADDPEARARVRVQLTGQRGPNADNVIRRFKFPDAIQADGHVGKREANRRMQQSDVLLLIAHADLQRYLPGKLFDYLAARRPVLVFGERGEASDLVERLGVGVLCHPGSATELRDALVRLSKLDMSSNEDIVNAWLAEHRREILAGRMLDIIESSAKAV